VRIAIQDVKGQIEGMGWDVAQVDGEEVTPELAKKIAAAKAWIRRPDPLAGRNFRACLSSWLEEILVTDALTLYPLTDRARRPLGLIQIDGATIYPVVDSLGRPPLPPEIAYQQIVHGQVETEFTLPELWYRPRHARPDCPYGRSPTEMVLLTVNLALRSQLYDLTYYTEGSIPEGIYAVPGYDNAELNDLQENWDAVLAGDDQARRRMRFAPEGQYQATKDRSWSYEFQEWLARVIAWAFGVSPMPIAKVMNRATAEQMESSALESGVRPVAEWVAEIFTDYLQGPLGLTDLKFVFGSDETEDGSLVYQRNVAYAGHAGLTLNEFFEQTGSKALEGEAGELRLIDTPTGPVFLQDLLAQREQSLKAGDAKVDSSLIQRAFLEVPVMTRDELRASIGLPPVGGAEGAEFITIAQVGPSVPAAPVAGDPGNASPADAAGETAGATVAADDEVPEPDPAEADLKRWQAFTLKRLKDGRPVRKFASQAIPSTLHRAVNSALERIPKDVSLEDASREVRAIFDCATLQRRMEKSPPASLVKPTRKIAKVIAAWLADQKDRVIAAALEELPDPSKAAGAPLRKKISDLELNAEDLVDDLSREIAKALTAGAGETASTSGFSLDTVPEAAVAYANERAAELVGMKWVDGELVTNPNPRFAITERLREDIQAKVTKAITEGWSPDELKADLAKMFSPARAETIARTETGLAYQEGALKVYEAGGQDFVDILDGAGCLPTGHDDDAPEADSSAKGVVQTESQADGQVWTLAQLREHRLGHPNCLPGSVEVVAPNRTAAFTRWFDGEVVVLHTAADDLLTCTPNHPVLSGRGWVAAKDLREGDYVIRSLDSERVARLVDPDYDEAPARIEKVAGSFLESLPVATHAVPASTEDFHGDGAGSEIYVVGSNRLARGEGGPAPMQHLSQPDFDLGSMGSGAFLSQGAPRKILSRSLYPSQGIVRSGSTPRALPRPDASLMETEAVRLCSHLEPSSSKGTADGAARDSEVAADGITGLSGLIAPVKVTKIRREKFSGHVYNLETEQGWYVAGGIVTHNCVRGTIPHEE
jgi:hypothetical protein